MASNEEESFYAIPPPRDPRPRPLGDGQGRFVTPDQFSATARLAAHQRTRASIENAAKLQFQQQPAAWAQYQQPPAPQLPVPQLPTQQRPQVTPVLLERHSDLKDVFFFGSPVNIDPKVIAKVTDSNRTVLLDNDGKESNIYLHFYMQKEATVEAVINDIQAIRAWLAVKPTATIMNVGCTETITGQWVQPKGQSPSTTAIYMENINSFLADFMERALQLAGLQFNTQNDWLERHHFYILNVPALNNIAFRTLTKNAALPPANYMRIREEQIRVTNRSLEFRSETHNQFGYNFAAIFQNDAKFIPLTHSYTSESKSNYMKGIRRLAFMSTCTKCRHNMLRRPVQLGIGLGHYGH